MDISKAETQRMKDSRFAKWKQKSVATRDFHKLPPLDSPLGRPYTTRPGVRLQGLCNSERQCDALDIVFSLMQLHSPNTPFEELIKGKWTNPTQCVSRLRATTRPATPLTSSELYSFEKDGVLSGEAVMRALGWPKHKCPMSQFSEAELRNLAGDAFSPAIAAVNSYAFWLNPYAPWWRNDVDTC